MIDNKNALAKQMQKEGVANQGLYSTEPTKIKTDKDFFKKIKENRDLDLAKKYTSFGPHKDDVVFFME